MISFWLRFLFFWFVAVPPVCAMGLGDFVQKALEREEHSRVARQQYTHRLQLLVEHLERNGSVTATRQVDARVRPDRELIFQTDLSEQAQANHRKRLRDHQKIMAVLDFRKLAPRFDLAFDGEETVNGRLCRKILYSPQKNHKPTSLEDKIIHSMTGTFWVDAETFDILRSEGRLEKPVSLAWFFATAREVVFKYESQTLQDGLVVPASFDLLYDIQTTVTYQRHRQFSQMSDYER